jgi:hypothetical protein
MKNIMSITSALILTLSSFSSAFADLPDEEIIKGLTCLRNERVEEFKVIKKFLTKNGCLRIVKDLDLFPSDESAICGDSQETAAKAFRGLTAGEQTEFLKKATDLLKSGQ